MSLCTEGFFYRLWDVFEGVGVRDLSGESDYWHGKIGLMQWHGGYLRAGRVGAAHGFAT